MSGVTVKVDNLGKKFTLGRLRNSNLRHTFQEGIKRILNRGEEKQEFWALQNINFEVKRGEILGIIGRNGAGKSTLLKILSRITMPSTGRFVIDGRVSSLLEVGTGFHAELTGRENIFLNGTILGMRRTEIKNKFEEIVAFSGIERFIDTAVKHYSSGMKVRLAFSVAAHLEPEILIIDEVLAVGDSEFQRKCLGKMEDVSKNSGRTVLFVSHNLAAVGQLCHRGLLLIDGKLGEEGPVSEVIQQYITINQATMAAGDLMNLNLRKGSGLFNVRAINLLSDNYQKISIARTGSTLILEIQFDRTIRGKEGAFRIDLALDNEQNMRIGWFSTEAVASNMKNNFETIFLKLPRFQFGSGIYYLTFYATWNGDLVDYVHQAFAFSVEDGDYFGTGKVIPKSQTNIYSDHEILTQ